MELEHGVWRATCVCGFVVRHPGQEGTVQRFETHLEIQRARRALDGQPHLTLVEDT